MKYSVLYQHISAVRVDGAVTCSGVRCSSNIVRFVRKIWKMGWPVV